MKNFENLQNLIKNSQIILLSKSTPKSDKNCLGSALCIDRKSVSKSLQGVSKMGKYNLLAKIRTITEKKSIDKMHKN